MKTDLDLPVKTLILCLAVYFFPSCNLPIPPSLVVAAPVIDKPSGTYLGPLSVTISCATAGAIIRHTLDGTDPDEDSLIYSEPLVFTEDAELKAKAFKTGMRASAAASSVYTLAYAAMLEATASWTSTGEDVASFFGTTLDSGDVNGDGYTDLVVGAFSINSQVGKVYLFPVTADGLAAGNTRTADGDSAAGSQFGAFLSVADVNGDGYDDIMVSGGGLSSNTGRAYLYLGGPKGPSASYDWSSQGDVQAGSLFSSGPLLAGDVNNDGFMDLLIGAQRYDGINADSGKAYLFLGQQSSPWLADTPVWEKEGPKANAYFGRQSGSGGDVNNDGYDDIAVGACDEDGNGNFYGTGAAFVYHGGSGGPSSTPDWNAAGDDPTDSGYGFWVDLAGDGNSDGYADLLVAARFYDSAASRVGKAYLYLGSASGLSASPAWTSSGNEQANQYTSFAIHAGDINNDGYGDAQIH